jgi:hypothetical protein
MVNGNKTVDWVLATPVSSFDQSTIFVNHHQKSWDDAGDGRHGCAGGVRPGRELLQLGALGMDAMGFVILSNPLILVYERWTSLRCFSSHSQMTICWKHRKISKLKPPHRRPP